MITNDEPNSLIDWNGPVVEYVNNRPLIPLPSFINQIQFSEDNPFDAVERQVNENDPFFGVFNLNSSLDNQNDSQNNSKNDSILNDSISEEVRDINLNDVYENKMTTTSSAGCSSDEKGNIAGGMYTTPVKVKSENDKSPFEISAVSTLSNISDFKEMVINRISNCISQVLHQTPEVDFFFKRTTPESISSQFENSNTHSRPPSALNNCLISHDSGDTSKFEKRIDDEFLQDFGIGEEYEDIQSIVPTWDEASSDEEIEKQVISSSNERSCTLNSQKKLLVSQIKKAKDIRAPLVSQDPNIRIKKQNIVSKEGPLKAMIPLSSMKKLEERRTASNTNDNKTLKKSKETPSLVLQKQKRWSAPIATSTPESLKQIPVNSKKSIPKNFMSNEYSRPSSPDSTSGSRLQSRINSITKSTTKQSCIRKLASNVVSSSTNVTFPRITSKTSKDLRNTSVTETVSKTPTVATRLSQKKNRNKENIVPFKC